MSLFNFITMLYNLPIDPHANYIVCGILAAIATGLAGFVASKGGKIGKALFVVILILIYLILFYITYGIIVAFRWIEVHWVLVIAILSAIIVLSLVCYYITRWYKNKTVNNEGDTN